MRKIGAVLLALVTTTVVITGAGTQAAAVTAVDWQPCPEAPPGHPARCAILGVPVDWASGQGRADLRVARLPAAHRPVGSACSWSTRAARAPVRPGT